MTNVIIADAKGAATVVTLGRGFDETLAANEEVATVLRGYCDVEVHDRHYKAASCLVAAAKAVEDWTGWSDRAVEEMRSDYREDLAFRLEFYGLD